MSELVVLKLGGSVVTEKGEPETVDGAALSTAAESIARFDGDVVVVHGGGSFGHYHANEHEVTRTRGTRDATAVYAIHDAMRRLNDAVVEALHDAGAAALPVHPLSVGARRSDGELAYPVDAVDTMIGEGFVPVAHGDGVAHEGSGVSILSGDELVVSIARTLDADRVGLCSAVPGVLDAEGEVIERIDSYEPVADALGGSDATDVTGGMAAKVRTLLSLDAPASIFDLDGIDAFLGGDSPGTRVR